MHGGEVREAGLNPLSGTLRASALGFSSSDGSFAGGIFVHFDMFILSVPVRRTTSYKWVNDPSPDR